MVRLAPVRFTFRSTFLGILLTLVSVTVSLVAVGSYTNARFTADDLSTQLLEQTSARVDEQVQKLITEAVDQSALNRGLLDAGRLQARDFPGLVAYWLEVMAVHRDLSSVFMGVEATGESTGVSRLQGKLSIWQSNANATTGTLDQRDYWPDGYPSTPYAFDPGKPAPDIRTRPWYVAARGAHHPIWTETYAFLGVTGVAHVQGVTYAVPVYAKSGGLLGVLSADFDLKGLCTFLQTLRIGKTGFAFVVERRADGSQRLIAHPDADVLAAASAGPAGVIAEPRVRSLMDASHDATSEFVSVHFSEGGERYIGGYRTLAGADAPPWLIGIVVPEADVMARVDRSNAISAAIALGGLLLALVFGMYLARQVARPLEQLSREMASIAELDLEPRPVPESIVLEVYRVAAAAESMKTGLRQKRVLEKYVPRGARENIERNRAGRIALGGARVRRAILFSDLRGFTSMSERLAPDAVVALLNAYLESMTAEILEHGGDINEYIGDAILAVFEDPLMAVGAAIAMQEALAKLRAETDNEDLRTLRMGIGIHVGDVVEGNIGTVERVKFGIVGDTVNLAARIQDRSRDGKHTCVLVSEAVRDVVESSFEIELVGDLTMKGKAMAVRVFEIVKRRP